jgi:hypothetical protein
VFFHQAGGLKLVKHAVYGSEADIFVGFHQAAVNIIGGKMLVVLVFQDLQDPLARMSNFQPGFPEVFWFHDGLSLFWGSLQLAKYIGSAFLIILLTIAGWVIVSFTLFAIREKIRLVCLFH